MCFGFCWKKKPQPNKTSKLGDGANFDMYQTPQQVYGFSSTQKDSSTKNCSNETPAEKEEEEDQKESTRANIKRVMSSPSKMRTADLTEIYKLPSKQYLTTDDVVTSNGYELGKEIGKGSYAVVYKARRIRDNFIVACKVMDITSATRNQSLSAKNELFILERINHPHIIKLYKHFIVETQSTRYVYIFMQFAESESLSVYMRQVKQGLPEPTAKKMFAQIVSAVNHMHSKGIAHRDLKMGNVLLNKSYDCIVTDFGLSRVAYRTSKGGKIFSNKFCGTVPYMAPEILLTKEYQVEYDPFIADIWAIGVILFCVVNRGYPFSENGNMLEQQMCHKIKFSKKISFEPSTDLIDLFYRLLDPNVDQRIKMDQLMVHPWASKEVKTIEEQILSSTTATPSTLSGSMCTDQTASASDTKNSKVTTKNSRKNGQKQ